MIFSWILFFRTVQPSGDDLTLAPRQQENTAPLWQKNRESRRERDNVTAFGSSDISRFSDDSCHSGGFSFYGLQICDCMCTVSLSENSGIRFGSSRMRSFLFQEILEMGWGSWVVVLPTLKVVTAAQLQSCASAVKRTKQAQGKNAVLRLWSLSLSVAQQYSFPRSFVHSEP